MQKPHYAEVPRKEPLHNFDVKQTIVPVDLEREHNRRNKLDYLTLRIKFIVPLGFLLAMFPLTLIMLLLSVARPVGDVDPAVGVLRTISYISESNPVVDIRPITGSQICDIPGYEPGGLGQWRATYPGCSCPSLNTLDERYCLTSEANLCQNITAQPETETFTWNGDRFCLRRLYDFIRTAGACPTNYQKCGDLICVRSTDPCPITDVQIIPETTAVPLGYQVRPLTFEQKLVFANSATSGSNKQFVQFSFATQNVCLDWNAFHSRTNGLSSVLEREDHAAGCKDFGTDAEAPSLNIRAEGDYNVFNNLDTMAATVPGYSTVIAGSDITLTARYRFDTKRDDLCAQFYVSNVPELIRDVEDFAYLYRGITISGVILSSITFIIALVYIRVLKRDGFWMINREEPFGRRFIFQIVLLHCAYAVVTAIMGNIALEKVNAQESYLKDIEDSSCFIQAALNTAMSEVVSYLTNKIDGLVFLNNIILFVAAGTTVAVIVNLLFRKLRGYDKDLGK